MPMENETIPSLLERIRLLETRNRQLELQYTTATVDAEEQKRKLRKLLDRITALNLNSIIGALYL